MLLIIGFAVGAVARLLLPGRDPIGIAGTIVPGIAGSFVGGFGENLIQYRTLSVRGSHPAGLIGSVIGALVLLLLLAPDRPGAGQAPPLLTGPPRRPRSSPAPRNAPVFKHAAPVPGGTVITG